MVKRFATKVPLVPSRALTGGTASGCGTAGEGTGGTQRHTFDERDSILKNALR
jgi:hypothetical protein